MTREQIEALRDELLNATYPLTPNGENMLDLARTALDAMAEVERREEERKRMSSRIRMQRQECRWMNAWANATQTTFYGAVMKYHDACARAAAAEAEVERLRADRDAGARDYCALMDRYDTHVNEVARLREVAINSTAHLAAAVSLLERGGKAAKKAAPSDKMFDQMLTDYQRALAEARAALADTGGKK